MRWIGECVDELSSGNRLLSVRLRFRRSVARGTGRSRQHRWHGLLLGDKWRNYHGAGMATWIFSERKSTPSPRSERLPGWDGRR